MTTKELLDTLASTKTAMKLEQLRSDPPEYKPAVIKEINWIARQFVKDDILNKAFDLAFVLFYIGLLIDISFVFIDQQFSASDAAARIIISCLSASKMCLAYKTWDKNKLLFLAATFGTIPIRIGIGLAAVAFLMKLPSIRLDYLIFSMIVYWVIFTIIEIRMFMEFSNKLERTSLTEP